MFIYNFLFISVTSDLKAMIVKLEGRVAAIEKAKPAAAAAAPAKAAPAPAADDEDDDDVDLFGSESGKFLLILFGHVYLEII